MKINVEIAKHTTRDNYCEASITIDVPGQERAVMGWIEDNDWRSGGTGYRCIVNSREVVDCSGCNDIDEAIEMVKQQLGVKPDETAELEAELGIAKERLTAAYIKGSQDRYNKVKKALQAQHEEVLKARKEQDNYKRALELACERMRRYKEDYHDCSFVSRTKDFTPCCYFPPTDKCNCNIAEKCFYGYFLSLAKARAESEGNPECHGD